jgi:hypothetical protein
MLRSPYFTVWIRPRVTVRELEKEEPTIDIPILAFLAGAAAALDRAVDGAMGDKGSLLGILGLSTLVGGLWGLLTFYVGSFVIEVTGGWLKGKADARQIRVALAWASGAESIFTVSVDIADCRCRPRALSGF